MGVQGYFRLSIKEREGRGRESIAYPPTNVQDDIYCNFDSKRKHRKLPVPLACKLPGAWWPASAVENYKDSTGIGYQPCTSAGTGQNPLQLISAHAELRVLKPSSLGITKNAVFLVGYRGISKEFCRNSKRQHRPVCRTKAHHLCISLNVNATYLGRFTGNWPQCGLREQSRPFRELESGTSVPL